MKISFLLIVTLKLVLKTFVNISKNSSQLKSHSSITEISKTLWNKIIIENKGVHTSPFICNKDDGTSKSNNIAKEDEGEIPSILIRKDKRDYVASFILFNLVNNRLKW